MSISLLGLCCGSSFLVDNVAHCNQRLHEGVLWPNKHESSQVIEVLTAHSRHESTGVEEVLTPDSRTFAGHCPHTSPNRLVFNAVSEPVLNNLRHAAQSQVCPVDNMGNDHHAYAYGDHIVTMDHMGRSVAILAQGQPALYHPYHLAKWHGSSKL